MIWRSLKQLKHKPTKSTETLPYLCKNTGEQAGGGTPPANDQHHTTFACERPAASRRRWAATLGQLATGAHPRQLGAWPDDSAEEGCLAYAMKDDDDGEHTSPQP
jgi:hypothetical protein